MNTINTKYASLSLLTLGTAIIAGMALHAYISARVNVAQAKQVQQDMNLVHQDQAQRKDQAKAAEEDNQKTINALLIALAQKKEQPVSPDAIVDMIIARMGTQATPQTEVPVDDKGKDLRDAASTTLRTRPLRDYMLDCDARAAELDSCRRTVTNISTQLDAERVDHLATQKEFRAATKALKGGSFWRRLKANTKWFVIGGAAGAGAVLVSRH
jgi:hypothetical protein